MVTSTVERRCDVLTFNEYDGLRNRPGGILPRDRTKVEEFEEWFTKDHKPIISYDPANDSFFISNSRKPIRYSTIATDTAMLDWGVEQHSAYVRAAADAREAYLNDGPGKAQKVLEELGVSMSLAHRLVISGRVKVRIDTGEFS